MREKQNNIILSNRLQAVASMVTAGSRICDVGCDHGFVPIYLIQRGISPKALAMDAKEGPLEQAKTHIRDCGLEVYIETRLSDGLHAYREGEADSLICAGMGGRLMMRILKENEEKTDSFRELILQPQSEVQQFRCFLRMQGYLLADENMIEEDGKFYPMMKAVKSDRQESRQRTMLLSDENEAQDRSVPQGESYDEPWRQRMEDKYGPLLLQRKHPVLYRYLEREKHLYEEVLEQLQTRNNRKQDSRYREVKVQLQDCLKVMEEMKW